MEVRRTVDNILTHRNFTSRLDYDAALVRLSEPIDISGESGTSILPVCIPTEEDVAKMYAGLNATVTGWGLTSEGRIYFKHKGHIWECHVISSSICNH